MKLKLQHEDICDDIEINAPWFGKLTVTCSGNPLERVADKQPAYTVVARDGSTKKLQLKAHFLDPVPDAMLDGKPILLARKLHLVESLFAVLPVGMFIGHKLLAVLLGVVVITTNFKILRSNLHGTLRWVLIYGQSLLAFMLLLLIEHLLWRTQ